MIVLTSKKGSDREPRRPLIVNGAGQSVRLKPDRKLLLGLVGAVVLPASRSQNFAMRSPPNVNCELLVPPPNGVVLFKDAS